LPGGTRDAQVLNQFGVWKEKSINNMDDVLLMTVYW
jgi:hypothetical protein